MKNNFVLQLLAVDFEETDFGSISNCAVCKAIKRTFPEVSWVTEGVDVIHINNDIYVHAEYDGETFLEDEIKAEECDFDNTVIRKIKLRRGEA